MIAPAKRKKERKRREKSSEAVKDSEAIKSMPDFNPEWINAFVILMLHKIGGTQAVTMKQLEAFDKITEGKEPILAWHEELQGFSITAPEYVMPVIEIPEKPKLIT